MTKEHCRRPYQRLEMKSCAVAGRPGKSAYELAVERGFVGTLNQWFASLQGEQGVPGDTGASGKSAYQLAVDGGFEGTEAQWLLSLKGEKGDPGDLYLDVTEAYHASGMTNPESYLGWLQADGRYCILEQGARYYADVHCVGGNVLAAVWEYSEDTDHCLRFFGNGVLMGSLQLDVPTCSLRLRGLYAPLLDSDAANKKYVDDAIAALQAQIDGLNQGGTA